MLYIGVDLGTSAVKLLMMDENGNIQKIVSKEYPLYFPHPGWSEQNPQDWFAQSMEGIKELTSECDKSQVAGISFGGQMHGLVVLDKDDQIIRPAILWNDGRTAKETDYLNQVIGKDKLSEYTANIAFAGFTAPKILWMREHEPENYAKIAKIMLPKDYLAYRLSGTFCTDMSDASGMLLMDVKNRCWSKEMLDICGLEQEQLPKLYESYAVDMGFTSVMYDASAKPFEDNVAETRSVVEYAHERGASVEAELGHILTSKAGAAEGNGKSYTREEAYTDPEMAKEFIERTNVDALAIGFGTAHGIYTEKPVLDLNRIALIKSAKDIPYVMHGGSGLSEEEYRTAIHNGIRKINYYTYLSLAGGRGVMQYLEDKKDKDAIYFEDIAKAGITAMKADVKRAMKIFESDGKI